MMIEADGFRFDFQDAIDVFVFDEANTAKPRFHGFPMKGVDLVVELESDYLFVEIKEHHDVERYDFLNKMVQTEEEQARADFKWLKNVLKYKFRDTYLFRYAEDKLDKPVRYICLINFENALNVQMTKALKQELPLKKHKLWQHELAKSCVVVNLQKWNSNFPKWPVEKI